MSSLKQTTANQQNATRSTGPKTDAGKRIVSQNGVTHGLTSKKLILSSEEQAEFDKLRDGLVAKHAPANTDECRLVEMHAVNAWRMVRLRAQEVAFFDRAAWQLMKDNPELTYDDAISGLFLDPAHPEKLRLFLRYQTAIERAYAKSLAELEAALERRRADEKAARREEDQKRVEEYDDDDYEEYDEEEDYEEYDEEEDYEDEENEDDDDENGFASQSSKQPHDRAA